MGGNKSEETVTIKELTEKYYTDKLKESDAYIKKLEADLTEKSELNLRLTETLEKSKENTTINEVIAILHPEWKGVRKTYQREQIIAELKKLKEECAIYKKVAHLYWEAENQFDHRKIRVDKLREAIKQMLKMEGK